MRIIFEEKDIQAGLFIIRNSSPIGSKDFRFAATVVFKIGYCIYSKDKPYGRISALTDGLFIPMGSKKDIADYLNNDEYGYRILCKEELIDIIKSSEQGFRIY